MNSTHLIIKSRTVAAQLQKTNPGAAQRLVRLVERWEALRSAQRKLCSDFSARISPPSHAVFAKSDLRDLERASPEDAGAIIGNTRMRIRIRTKEKSA